MRVQRSRVVDAPLEDVWRLVSDPYSMPRWWPHTQRVEGVSKAGFTTVLGAERSGRTVRADWRLETSRKPVRRWSQELDGTPFARLFTRNEVEVRVEGEGERARVTLASEQRVRGWARLAPFMIRRAAKRQVDAALDGIVEAVGP
jgi:carbon monoxide dehydrogenase subunit G